MNIVIVTANLFSHLGFSDQPTTDKSKRKKQKAVSLTKQNIPVTQESASAQNTQPQYTGL